MKRKLYVFLSIMLCICCMVGCSFSVARTEVKESDKDIDKDIDKDGDYKYPSNEDIIVTNLGNCDITFINCMPNYDIEFEIVSTMEIVPEKMKVKFDSDIGIRVCTIEEREDDKSTQMEYDLFLAYNGYGSKHNGEIPISKEDYKSVKKNIPLLYSYKVFIGFDYINSVFEDDEINKMTIVYDTKEYNFDIGRIKFDKEQEFRDFRDNAVEQMTSITWGTSVYYSTEGRFELDLRGLFCTKDKKTLINDISFVTGETYDIYEIEVIIENDKGKMNFIWDKNKAIEIPPQSEVGFVIHTISDSIKNNVSYNALPIVAIEYEVDGKNDVMHHQSFCRMSTLTKYQIYAYLADQIDIFGMYINDMLNEERDEII